MPATGEYIVVAMWLCGQAYGIELGTRMCKALLDAGVPGLHLYTLNLEASALAILENLGLVNKAQVHTAPVGTATANSGRSPCCKWQCPSSVFPPLCADHCVPYASLCGCIACWAGVR